jgi:hypothetical protein
MKENNLKKVSKISLSVVIFITLVSSLGLFTSVGIAQEYPGCFMINSSGRKVDLNNICLNKVTVCEGALDSDGFPLILSPQLKQLQSAITKALKTDGDDSDAEEGVSSALKNLLSPFFSPRTLELEEELSYLRSLLPTIKKPSEAAEIKHNINTIVAELKTDPCFLSLLSILEKKFPQYSFSVNTHEEI